MHYRRHLFVCTQQRGNAGGKPACGDRGGKEILAAVERGLLGRAGADECAVTGTACLGPCFDGPNAVMYPSGEWLDELRVEGAADLIDRLLTDDDR